MKTKKFYRKYVNLTHDTSNFGGLCIEVGDEEIFKLFIPTKDELDLHYKDGGGYMFWGRENRQSTLMEFGSLRQTIILFCAAINDEL